MNEAYGYFDHYRTVNDLTAKGRRQFWGYLDACLGECLPSDRAARILDVGCGAGILLEWLTAKGYWNALGVDRNIRQIEFARSLGLDVQPCQSSSAFLRESPRLYDLVVLKDVLEHCSSEEANGLLEAIRERLAPSGTVYLSVPNANSSFAMRWRHIDPTHLRSYTEQALRWELERAGLQIVKLKGDDYWKPSSLAGLLKLLVKALFRLQRRLEALAEFGAEGRRLVLSLNIAVIARKP